MLDSRGDLVYSVGEETENIAAMAPDPVPAVFCGPSGWSHIGSPKVDGRRQHPLEFVASHFDAVEIHDSFSRIVRPEQSRVWVRKVEANRAFQFTAKLHRRFTHDRMLDPGEIAAFREGLMPLVRAGRFGCLLMQFPWSFRYTSGNREFLRRLRRTFHEFPLAAEMRHASWMSDEAIGCFIDFHLGFCNIDQPSYTKSMPPTAFLTSGTGYVRLHGRNAFRWFSNSLAHEARRYDYFYSDAELSAWKNRIERISGFASKLFVITNNDAGPKALMNASQLQALLSGDDKRSLPPEVLRRHALQPQAALFGHFGKAVA